MNKIEGRILVRERLHSFLVAKEKELTKNRIREKAVDSVLTLLISRTRINTKVWQDQQLEDSRCSTPLRVIAKECHNITTKYAKRVLRFLTYLGLIVIHAKSGLRGQDEYTVTLSPLQAMNAWDLLKMKPTPEENRRNRNKRYYESKKAQAERIRELEEQLANAQQILQAQVVEQGAPE